jgi:hypothetical protein
VLALTRRISRPSPALIVAIVALVMALGGTSYAALKITGKNVQNSTLTGLDFKNKSLEEKELKPDTLTGSRINESTLGTVPSAQHAATADSATTAAKATDADAVGGIPAAQLMVTKQRTYESNISATDFPNDSTIGAINDVQAGTYLVMVRLSYHNPGVTGNETCRLVVPSTDDIAQFRVGGGETEVVSLQEVVTTNSVYMPHVTCTGDGSDDITSGSIIAIRLD